jgi:endogenous inhibitor of DNA gyrase (YacG/DUF329 family)
MRAGADRHRIIPKVRLLVHYEDAQNKQKDENFEERVDHSCPQNGQVSVSGRPGAGRRPFGRQRGTLQQLNRWLEPLQLQRTRNEVDI